MRQVRNKINIVIMAILLLTVTAFSQNAPVTTIGNAFGQVGSTVAVPVTATNFTGIGAMTLRLYYNPSELTFVSSANENILLSADILIANNLVSTTSAYIAVVWANTSGATLQVNAKLFDVNFTMNASPAAITFDNTTSGGTNCEYGNVVGDALLDSPSALYYVNGSVSIPRTEKDILSFSFPQQTGVSAINTTNHTVSAYVPFGISLGSISPTIIVSGGATINPNTNTVHNFSFPFIYTVTAEDGSSQAWVITIKRLQFCSPGSAPKTTIGSIAAAIGSQISVPVITKSCFNDISSMTMRMYYNPTQLTFVSTSNENAVFGEDAVFANNLVSETSAYIGIVWANVVGATLNEGSKLFDVNFIFNAGPATISFDNTGSEGFNCEWANSNAEALTDIPSATFYTSGIITDVNYVKDTKVRAADCGSTVNTIAKFIYCDPIVGATNYEWEFTTTDFSFTRLRGGSNAGFYLNWVTGIEYGKTYNVRVRAYRNGYWGNFSTSCQITTGAIPSTKVRADYCGITVSNLSQYIYCDIVIGAVDYEWEFVNSASNFLFVKQKGAAQNNINLSLITGIEFGITYDVRVRTKVGSQWGDFGYVCQVITPSFPTTKVRFADCGITVSTLNTVIFCDGVRGATDYVWEFVNVQNGFSFTRTRGSANTGFYVSWVTGIEYGTTYDVSVKVKIGTQWGNFGTVCQITTPSGAKLQNNDTNEQSKLEVRGSKLELAACSFQLSLMSNPVTKGSSFAVSLQSDANVNGAIVNIYNIIGQIVYTKQINVDANNYVLNIDQNEKLSAGLHIVRAEINGEIKILKLVIE